MTTTPERLNSAFLFRVIDSILSQITPCHFKIVLFIPYQSIRTGALYPDVSFLAEQYGADQLEVHRCKDMGPATKFSGLLSYLSCVSLEVSHIYISDDDIILRDNVFMGVLQKLQSLSSLIDYSRMVLAHDVGMYGGMKTVAGYAGILVPIEFFRELAADVSLEPVWSQLAEGRHPCFNVDDILLSKLFSKFKFSIEWTGQNPFTDVMDRRQTDEHPEWFELCKHTQRDNDNLKCLSEILHL